VLQKILPLLEDPNKPFIHRDLSWLQFNERVLAQARSPNNPLLERLRFLGITGSNLDEFFMIRFASMKEQIRSLKRGPQINIELVDRLRHIRDEVLISVGRFENRQVRVFNDLVRQLFENGIRVYKRSPGTHKLDELAKEVFEKNCLPHLKEPEKFAYEKLKLVTNLQGGLIYPNGQMIGIPRSLPAAYYAWDENKKLVLFFLDDLVSQRMQLLIGTHKRACIFRITRDADISGELEEEDPESIPDAIKKRMISRDQGRVVRLQLTGTQQMLNIEKICKTLSISALQIFKTPLPLFIHGCYQVVNELQKQSSAEQMLEKLVYPRLENRLPKPLRSKDDIFKKIKEKDQLLHHPYDSFDAYTRLLEAAVKDPQVQAISQTIYRVDTLSKVTELLKEAAKTKNVRVIIEPRARFDELNNIKLAEELRQAGVKVVFSFGKLKLHAKIALIERKEEGKIVNYTHLSTGNYNATTARLYTDLAILTAHPGMGSDAKTFMEAVSEERIPTQLQHLILAPTDLHKRLLSLIDRETKAAKDGKKGRIFAKVNALVDYNLVNSLYAASQAGVKVDLFVRGACSLIPRIKDLSDNIRVFSLVDRFLEHSRMYYFQNSNQLFLTSADWMPRNFFSRLEIAFPVLDEQIHQFLISEVIPTYLRDRAKTRELDAMGIWRKRKSLGGDLDIRAQAVFQKMAENDYAGTPLYV